MIKRIRELLLRGGDTPELDPVEERRAVTAALLVQAALMDGAFDETERRAISHILKEEFSLTSEDISALIYDAEGAVRHSSQLFGFTRIADQCLEYDQRIDLMEMLWRVVYADGIVHDYESNLMRRIAGLLHVTDRDSAHARQRVIRV